MSAAIVLADVTVTASPGKFAPPGKPWEFYGLVNFGDGAGNFTYDTNGVPVPAPGAFGMRKQTIRLLIQQMPGTYEYVYDPTVRTANPVAPYGTIRIYARANGAELSGAVAATAVPVMVVGE